MSKLTGEFDRNNIDEQEDLNDKEQVDRFDWNSKALTVENCGDKLGGNLMRVLVLPTIDYFLPYLAASGFPDYLIQHPDIWKSVFAEFTPLYEKAIDDFDEWGEEVHSKWYTPVREIYELNPVLKQAEMPEHRKVFVRGYNLVKFHIHLKAWQDILKMLADKAGKTVAIELERWVYYHYFSDRFNNAVERWWIVLNDTDSVPDCLEPMLSQIEGLNDGNELFKVTVDLEELYGRYYDEYDLKSNSAAVGLYYLSDGSNSHHPPYIANYYLLEQAWTKTKVMPILQLFARTLNPEQIQIVVQWAKEFDGGVFSDDSSILCEDELITNKVLFSDFHSILDANNIWSR
jgi:hypothetical protein